MKAPRVGTAVRKAHRDLSICRHNIVDRQMHPAERPFGSSAQERLVRREPMNLAQASSMPTEILGPELVDEIELASIDDFIDEAAYDRNLSTLSTAVGRRCGHRRSALTAAAACQPSSSPT